MEKLNTENLGMNPRFDYDNLPKGYIYQSEPHYIGDGMHSVHEMQELLNQYKEYCHQQALIKQTLIAEVITNN